LILEASQTIQNVGELQEKLQHLLDIGNKIDIDASAVTQIDTATMQLLLVLKLTASSLQKEVNIDFPSDRFLEAAKLLGVAEMLSVDQVASGFF
jgi:ABC-type transporter Mla MlaB component